MPGGGGWSRSKGGGAEPWLVLHRQISSFFQTGKSCLGCAHLQGVTVFTPLPGSTDSFLSFSQTQLVFFMRRAEQTVGALPPCCVQKHITSDLKSPCSAGQQGWGVACHRDKDPSLDKHCLSVGGVLTLFSQHTHTHPFPPFLLRNKMLYQ